MSHLTSVRALWADRSFSNRLRWLLGCNCRAVAQKLFESTEFHGQSRLLCSSEDSMLCARRLLCWPVCSSCRRMSSQSRSIALSSSAFCRFVLSPLRSVLL